MSTQACLPYLNSNCNDIVLLDTLLDTAESEKKSIHHFSSVDAINKTTTLNVNFAVHICKCGSTDHIKD